MRDILRVGAASSVVSLSTRLFGAFPSSGKMLDTSAG
jgi:hypothetical protein